jgi:hypothetical protein
MLLGVLPVVSIVAATESVAVLWPIPFKVGIQWLETRFFARSALEINLHCTSIASLWILTKHDGYLQSWKGFKVHWWINKPQPLNPVMYRRSCESVNTSRYEGIEPQGEENGHCKAYKIQILIEFFLPSSLHKPLGHRFKSNSSRSWTHCQNFWTQNQVYGPPSSRNATANSTRTEEGFQKTERTLDLLFDSLKFNLTSSLQLDKDLLFCSVSSHGHPPPLVLAGLDLICAGLGGVMFQTKKGLS